MTACWPSAATGRRRCWRGAAPPRRGAHSGRGRRRLAPPAGPRPPARRGLLSVRDLLFHLPRRYDDFTRPVTLGWLRDHEPEGPVSATGTVLGLVGETTWRRGIQRTVARLRDASGDGEAIWFGRGFVERRRG